ncbi:hypothetical protein ACFWV1_32850 [Streptomyces sp. NPDC058700]|uniref:hypothetical protein n=1 Tax=unclassified Streptomyces TaxID=2593676 RepID=UPI003650E040
MQNTPAADQPTDPTTSLTERIDASRVELAAPAEQVADCPDTASLVGGLGGGLLGGLSDRNLKRDVLAVDWTR